MKSRKTKEASKLASHFIDKEPWRHPRGGSTEKNKIDLLLHLLNQQWQEAFNWEKARYTTATISNWEFSADNRKYVFYCGMLHAFNILGYGCDCIEGRHVNVVKYEN